MSKLAQCPECGTKLRIPENASGKTVRCTNCGYKIPVAKAASIPRSPTNGAAAPGQAPEIEGGSWNVTLWVVGCLALLFLCILLPAGGGAAWWFMVGSKAKTKIMIDMPLGPEDLGPSDPEKKGAEPQPKSRINGTPEPKGDDQNK